MNKPERDAIIAAYLGTPKGRAHFKRAVFPDGLNPYIDILINRARRSRQSNREPDR